MEEESGQYRIGKEERGRVGEGSGWGLWGPLVEEVCEVVPGQAESSTCSHQRLESLDIKS